ncbi:LAFE_0D05886g1_1 [Lachancea fermentati]|uniref:LAFE_0D05886g1_1 n=1 Tax=Lachancea fermentati TaxID=4955 RepID=A0A1G4MB62_LACFM|nr:LAFE_0D05886g1_1 [Lachancea fermentati]
MGVRRSTSRANASERPQIFETQLLTPISCSDRSHRICRLSNGILVILVSDPRESYASCALSVATGSHNDPESVAGLAHLCEHTIVSGGSKRFPDPDVYHNVISRSGGSHNAFTTGEQTTFFFELPAMSIADQLVFDQSLEVFACSFRAPLFRNNVIDKEIFSIESEHTANLASTNKVLYQVTRHLACPSHPFSRFCTGNATTLTETSAFRTRGMRARLVNYFKSNYTPDNMALALRGPQSLNTLAKLATTHFGDFPTTFSQDGLLMNDSRIAGIGTSILCENSRKIKRRWLEKYSVASPFSDGPLNSIFVQLPKAPVLRLIFPVNIVSSNFSEKDIRLYSIFWRELLGDEGEGSFGDYLKRSGYVTSIFSSISHFCTGSDGLILHLDLTNMGWVNADKIVSVFFHTFLSLILTDTESLAIYLSDLVTSDLLSFLYQDLENSPMEMCSILSSRLLSDTEFLNPILLLKGSPLPDFLDKTWQSDSFQDVQESRAWWIKEAQKFQRFIEDYVNHLNSKLILLGDLSKCPLANLAQFSMETDLYYQFEYCKARVDITRTENKMCSSQFDFFIRKENPFIPSAGRDLNLIKHALVLSAARSMAAPLSLLLQSDMIQDTPRLVGKNSNYEFWLKEEFDLYFKSRTIVTFELISTCLESLPMNTMHLEVLAQLLFDSLSAVLYPSEALGYTYEISASSRGDVRLSFTISGFPEGVYIIIALFIEEIVKLADQNDIKPSIFRRARVLVRKKYEDAAAADSTTLASLGLLVVLEKCMWSLEERFEALEELDIRSFQSFCSSLIKGSKYLNLFIQGDVTFSDKINSLLNSRLTGHLGSSIPNGILLEPETAKMKEGTNAFIKQNGHIDDPNNSIVYFLQTGDRDDKYAFFMTTFTDFLMSLTLIPELRTRRQIGYVLLGGIRILSNTIGIHITSMSDASPHTLENKIDEYLAYLEEDLLAVLKKEEFQSRFVEPFQKLVETGQLGKMSKTSGPANLMSRIEANVRSGNLRQLGRSMKSHKKLKNQITYRRYNFDVEEEQIDTSLISSLTLASYLEFFRTRISEQSPRRCKLSIMVCSTMDPHDITNKNLFMQIDHFLRHKGLPIPSSELSKIVSKADGNSSTIIKELLQYFGAKGKSLKLCSTVMVEAFKIICSSAKAHRVKALDNNSKNAPLIPTLELSNANYFRNVSNSLT